MLTLNSEMMAFQLGRSPKDADLRILVKCLRFRIIYIREKIGSAFCNPGGSRMVLCQIDGSQTEPSEEPNSTIQIKEYTKSVQNFNVAGHLVQLPPGLFCLTVEDSPRTDGQPPQPSVRISPWPTQNRCMEITGCRPDGWLSPGADAALLRVHTSTAHVLITIHQLPNEPAAEPRINIKKMLPSKQTSQVSVSTPPSIGAARTAVNIIAHIQGRGDVEGRFGEWIGVPGCKRAIEGFCIWNHPPIEAGDVSYQAVIGNDWISPLSAAGEYCGTRGMELPIIGLNVHLSGDAALKFDLTYSASFVDGTRVGPLKVGTICKSVSSAPLEAILLELKHL